MSFNKKNVALFSIHFVQCLVLKGVQSAFFQIYTSVRREAGKYESSRAGQTRIFHHDVQKMIRKRTKVLKNYYNSITENDNITREVLYCRRNANVLTILLDKDDASTRKSVATI